MELVSGLIENNNEQENLYEENFQEEQGLENEENFQEEQAFQNQQNFQEEQGLENEENFQEEQAFQNQQNFQEEQDFQNEENFQEEQAFQNQQNFQEEQAFQNQQNFQEEQAFQNEQEYQQTEGQYAENYTATQGQTDPVEKILAEYTGIPEPNEFSGAPALPGTMRNLALGEAPESYVIRSGDTLYDICDQLLGEAIYWPKLWSMNNNIKNPHFIYPEFVLNFFPGDTDTPPMIKVSNIEEFVSPEGDINPDSVVETEKLFKKEDTGLELLNPEDIVIPPKIMDIFRDDEGLVQQQENYQLDLPALILPQKLSTLAKVKRSTDGALSVQEDTIGFVQGNSLDDGAIYTIMRYKGSVGGGHRYDFVASAQIKELTGKSNIARALFFNYTRMPRHGDIVVDYRSQSRKVASVGVDSEQIDAKIIALTDDEQTFGAMGDFAYLSIKDSSDISKNQKLHIYEHSNKRILLSAADQSRKIGTLQIIDVFEDLAVSYITYSSQEIYVGDATKS